MTTNTAGMFLVFPQQLKTFLYHAISTLPDKPDISDGDHKKGVFSPNISVLSSFNKRALWTLT